MIKLFQISSVENIMPKVEQKFTPISKLTVLKGEKASYQIAYAMDNPFSEFRFELESDIKEHLKVYKVRCVPVNRTVYTYGALEDDNYLSHDSGMYPDLLEEFNGDIIKPQFYFQGLFIEINGEVPHGTHKIKITISNEAESVSTTLNYEVLNLELPEQELKYFISVHGDCIANYYKMEVFSEEFWQMLEKFIRISAYYGSNGLTPPIFTPPVDTAVGGERTTVQLVDVFKDGDKYTFDFTKFERYIEICRDAGIKNFYMPPFFTQWGAEFTPKIIAHENGEEKRIFGWDVKSTDEKYFNFLSQFLPELIKNIEKLGIKDGVIFSLSDEPLWADAVARYKKLNEFLKPYFAEFKTMDAFSSDTHFKKSGTKIPLIPSNLIGEFEDKISSDIYIYYCCAQDYKVSNRLIAMPLYRNRSFGYQLYKYDIKGFLHWALNFYSSALSVRPINPFYETDADGGYPAGDTFSVYPGENGPLPSMRLVVFNEALQDLRAIRLLESYVGREETEKLLEDITGKITIKNCAKSARTILDMRIVIMKKLKEFIEE